jgi:hypothetical protein
VIVVLATAGCGGEGSAERDPYAKFGGMSEAEWREMREKKQEEERLEEERLRQERSKRWAAERQRALAPKEQERPVQKIRRAAAKPTTPQALPPLPMLPEAFSDWGPRDYIIARIQGDPALPAAVRSLGEKTVGDESAAELLARLLHPQWLAELRDKLKSRGKRTSTRKGKTDPALLIEAIVAALGTNGTQPARRALLELVAGQFETEDDKAAALAAVRSLAGNPCAENEEILFRLLVEPEKVRPEGRGDVTPQDLQRHAVALLKPAASSDFRVRVAQTIVDPATPEELRELRRHWGDGPQSLRPAKLAEGMLADPGAAVVVKMLLRELDAEAKLLAGHSRTGRWTSPDRRRRIREIHGQWLDHFREAEEDWVDAANRLQGNLCARIWAASEVAAAERLSPMLHPVRLSAPESLPLDLPPTARVVATYSFDWQREVGGRLPSELVDPMEIRYVRLEEETRPSKLLVFFRRRVEDCVDREIEEGVWLEGLDDGSQPGRKRSIDVRIRRAVTGLPHLPDEEQPLVIEVLTVEINDPSRRGIPVEDLSGPEGSQAKMPALGSSSAAGGQGNDPTAAQRNDRAAVEDEAAPAGVKILSATIEASRGAPSKPEN